MNKMLSVFIEETSLLQLNIPAQLKAGLADQCRVSVATLQMRER